KYRGGFEAIGILPARPALADVCHPTRTPTRPSRRPESADHVSSTRGRSRAPRRCCRCPGQSSAPARAPRLATGRESSPNTGDLSGTASGRAVPGPCHGMAWTDPNQVPDSPVQVHRRTENGEAPRWQGATTENIGNKCVHDEVLGILE